ncbi:hypothetical protein GCM10007422_24130 [Pedobacter zeae]|uniref:FeoB-associated Cys-rich membrane protein n=1 Tax=Pedobacter zeae TaxID=1737356 RepID=A0ABQ1XZ47_9SPHI|nr:hypothetical protein GCM10007422_24130 [Pedobacter zeae]
MGCANLSTAKILSDNKKHKAPYKIILKLKIFTFPYRLTAIIAITVIIMAYIKTGNCRGPRCGCK